MKHSLKTVESISMILTAILGVLFHFIYSWSGESPVAGLFFPVNESTWEHLKLIFFPILFVSIAEAFFIDARHRNYIGVKFLSVLIGMVLTVVCFYTYSGVYGKNSDVLNILIYLLSIAAAYRFSYLMLTRKKPIHLSTRWCYLGFSAMLLLFFFFTIFPPAIGLFRSPI